MLTAGSSSLFSLRSPAATHSSQRDTHLTTLHPPAGPSLTCKLKHLGLAHNGMTGRAFCSLLDCLHRNTALTSIDLSHNELQHTSQVRESLRQFLRMNRGLRSFDLSHNRLTADSVKGIQLGLLENDVLLLLPLVGNGSAERASEFSLVQVTPLRLPIILTLGLHHENYSSSYLWLTNPFVYITSYLTYNM